LILRLFLKALKDMDGCKVPDVDQFLGLILNIVFYGASPHLLAYGTTIEMHLHVIQDSLQAQYKPTNGAEDGTTAAKDKAGERDKDETVEHEITDNRDDDVTQDEEPLWS
jgi:hypothetical protein